MKPNVIIFLSTRARKPWDRQAWDGVRKAADEVLRRGKVIFLLMGLMIFFISEHPWMAYMYILNQVRDEADTEQFGRLDKEQQEEMKKFERPVSV